MNYKNLLSHINIGKGIITFGDIKTKEHKFDHHKNPIF